MESMWINYLPYVVDAACLCTLLGFFISGCKHGFASKMLRALSAVLAMVITYCFFMKVTELLVQIGLEKQIASHLKIGTEEISELILPSYIKQSLTEDNREAIYAILGVETLEAYIRYRLARIILNTISILLLFVVSWAVLLYLSTKLKVVNKIPLIGTVNALLGGGMSLIVSLILLSFLLFLVPSMGTGKEWAMVASDAIEKSVVAQYLQKVNWFITWVLQIS